MVRIQERKQAQLELSDMGENGDRSAKFSKSCIIFSLLFYARCDFFFGVCKCDVVVDQLQATFEEFKLMYGALNVHNIPSQGNNTS